MLTALLLGAHLVGTPTLEAQRERTGEPARDQMAREIPTEVAATSADS